MNTRQLVLIDENESSPSNWRLDEHTRQVGLDGVAEARRALREALARHQRGDEATAA
ncbi:MAG: hypothetical protein ACXIVQ_00765 [Acidimicrobiales bacterium]